MKILALDTSGLVASAAILEDDRLIAEYTINNKMTHSQTLMPMINEIAGRTSLDLSTVDAIALAAGPGSFTGLRIGSATAKGLGLVLNKPLIEVPTLAALAYNLYGTEALICPIMDARRGQVYNGLYRFRGGHLITVCDQRAIAMETLIGELNAMAGDERILFLGDGVPVFRDKLLAQLKAVCEFAPAHVNRQRAASVAALGLTLLAEGQMTDPASHTPVYLRRSQAERERDDASLVIRPVTEADIGAILKLEASSDSSEGWTESSLRTYLARQDTCFLAAERDGRFAGYVGLLMIPEDGDVLNITVDPALRRLGIGERLMASASEAALRAGVTALHLEVREGNTAALGLYDKLGFVRDGLRRHYYHDPEENAVTMTLRTEK